MRNPILVLALALLCSCAQMVPTSGTKEYFSCEAVEYAVDGKTEVGPKKTYLLEFVMAKDRSRIFEKRSHLDPQRGLLEFHSSLERIGQSDGYIIKGPAGRISGLMSYTNPERNAWRGEIFFEKGGRLTYESSVKDGKGLMESQIFTPDRKLLATGKTVSTEISAEEYAKLVQEMKVAKKQ
jgi:hypothetical protein